MASTILKILGLLILFGIISCSNNGNLADKEDQKDPQLESVQSMESNAPNSLPNSIDDSELTSYVLPNVKPLLANEFFTKLSFGGEKFSINSIGDFDVNEAINIKSVITSKGYQISFDFGNECNALENGSFKYLSTNSDDIFLTFGCSEDFSKIRRVHIRLNPEYLDQTVVLYEKPFLQGSFHFVKMPNSEGPDTLTLNNENLKNISEISSMQLPKNFSARIFKDNKCSDSIYYELNASISSDYYFIPDIGSINFISGKSIQIIKKPDLKPQTPQNTPLPPAPPPRLIRR